MAACPSGETSQSIKACPSFAFTLMFLWINQNHAVLIEELRVALHQEFEVLLILIGEAQNRNGDDFLGSWLSSAIRHPGRRIEPV
jgi:hypothetical protein